MLSKFGVVQEQQAAIKVFILFVSSVILVSFSCLSKVVLPHIQVQQFQLLLIQNTQTKNAEVQQVKGEWQDVQDESENLNVKANDYFATREDRLNSVRDENLGRIELLEEDVELLRVEKARLMSTIDDLRSKINSNRMNSVDPSVLVDGRVLEVGSGNEVFIDRGL